MARDGANRRCTLGSSDRTGFDAIAIKPPFPRPARIEVYGDGTGYGAKKFGSATGADEICLRRTWNSRIAHEARAVTKCLQGAESKWARLHGRCNMNKIPSGRETPNDLVKNSSEVRWDPDIIFQDESIGKFARHNGAPNQHVACIAPDLTWPKIRRWKVRSGPFRQQASIDASNPLSAKPCKTKLCLNRLTPIGVFVEINKENECQGLPRRSSLEGTSEFGTGGHFRNGGNLGNPVFNRSPQRKAPCCRGAS